MNDRKKPKSPVPSTESQIRQERKFRLNEALGRENTELLKGASPVARGRQVLLEIEHFLRASLEDPDGALRRTILSRVAGDAPLLARHFDRPLGALHEFLSSVLAEDHALAGLVRETDARWGREYHERPRFETEDHSPDPDDPYTISMVRELLVDLVARLDV